jgi:putative transposase
VTCRVLKVSTSGFYEWRHRRPSVRDLEDAHLIHTLRDVHAGSRRTYGVRRCRAEPSCVRAGSWLLRISGWRG